MICSFLRGIGEHCTAPGVFAHRKIMNQTGSGTSKCHAQQENLVQERTLCTSFCFPLSPQGSVVGRGKEDTC